MLFASALAGTIILCGAITRTVLLVIACDKDYDYKPTNIDIGTVVFGYGLGLFFLVGACCMATPNG